jgi:hypothetical protein
MKTHKIFFIPGCVQMVVFVAAGFSLRRTGETPVPPEKLEEKYSIGRNSVLNWCGGFRRGSANRKVVFFPSCLN